MSQLLSVIEYVNTLCLKEEGRDNVLAEVTGHAAYKLAEEMLRHMGSILELEETPADREDIRRRFRFSVSVNPKEQAEAEEKKLDDAFAAGMRHAAKALREAAGLRVLLGGEILGMAQANALHAAAKHLDLLARRQGYVASARGENNRAAGV